MGMSVGDLRLQHPKAREHLALRTAGFIGGEGGHEADGLAVLVHQVGVSRLIGG
jgi:hypothetical protein